jgi:transcriptional regulator with XRE-family HTH domain
MKEPPKATSRARWLLAENLQALRLSKHLSQEKIATLAGFHRTYVSQVERCLKNVSLDNVQRLADVLEVPVDQLLRESSPKPVS